MPEWTRGRTFVAGSILFTGADVSTFRQSAVRRIPTGGREGIQVHLLPHLRQMWSPSPRQLDVCCVFGVHSNQYFIAGFSALVYS